MTTHSKVTVSGLVDAVRDSMATVTGVVAKALETSLETIADPATVHVNWAEVEGAAGSKTHMNTFGKGLQLRRIVIEIQLYAAPRGQLAEGLVTTAAYADAIMAELEDQSALTPFGLSGVHTFHWTGRQGIIPDYAGAPYHGALFTLEFLCH